MNPNTVGKLVDQVYDNGPTRIRVGDTVYEVKHFGTYRFEDREETP